MFLYIYCYRYKLLAFSLSCCRLNFRKKNFSRTIHTHRTTSAWTRIISPSLALSLFYHSLYIRCPFTRTQFSTNCREHYTYIWAILLHFIRVFHSYSTHHIIVVMMAEGDDYRRDHITIIVIIGIGFASNLIYTKPVSTIHHHQQLVNANFSLSTCLTVEKGERVRWKWERVFFCV